MLCDIVENEQWVPYRTLFPSQPVSSQIILETNSFIVIPDIGPIVEGYCLIISKRHIPAISHLDHEELYELARLHDCVTTVLAHIYGAPIIYEHGELSFSKNAGACIDHAHLHIVPTTFDLVSACTEINFIKMGATGLWDHLHSDSGYLYYEDQSGEAYYAWVNHCKQQLFRRMLAKATRSDLPWNWRDYIRYADILDTRIKIQNCIQKLTEPLTQAWAKS